MPTWQQLKSNPKLWDIFYLRQKIVSSIREFFQQKNFLELFTPILQPAVIPESYTDIFSTSLYDRNLKKSTRFLIPSPEVSVKKMIAAGLIRGYEITHCFRNRESGSNIHHYEFTMLEWYRTQAVYMDILKNFQNLLLFVAQTINGIKLLVYGKKKMDLSLPWKKISMNQALEKHAGISLSNIRGEKISAVARKKGYSVKKNDAWEEIFNQIFLNEIEPYLGSGSKPTVIYDYPSPLAGLGKLKEGNPDIVERFEIYIGGLELADCCSELTDPEEQGLRFRKNLAEIKSFRKNPVIPDQDFLDAIKTGLPPCAGIAVGLDRLLMLFADKKNLKETFLTFDS